MFPFHIPNAYINPSYSYNLNYDLYRQPQIQGNPFIYPYNYQNFNLLHETPIQNFLTSNQPQYFIENNQNCQPIHKPISQKRKRITKKLTLTQVKKQIRSLNAEFKTRRKTFKYFDPSRAPPITSLRNHQQLVMDLRLSEQKTDNVDEKEPCSKLDESLRKLEILLKQPNQRDYPFLICKKRTYHRNLKRRYSVAYFQQRAAYILNKEPIPASLHPKNKVRKSRCSKKNMSQVSQYVEECQSSSYSEFSGQKSKLGVQKDDFGVHRMKVANKISKNESQIKQGIVVLNGQEKIY